MANTVAQTTQAPMPVKLLDGREYRVSPPTIGDLGDFETWIKGQRVKAVEAAHLPSEKEERLIFACFERPITGQEYDNWNKSLAGIRHMCWRCLSANHPEITEAGMAALVDDTNLNSVMKIINGMGASPSENPLAVTGEPTAPVA